MSDEVATALVLVVMLTGLIGTLVPILPGILLEWVAVIAYGFFVGFGAVAVVVIIVVSALAALSVLLGVMLPKRAAEESGASTKSQVAAAIGAIVGFFVIPVVGLIVGALVGIGMAEYHDKRDWMLARTSTIAVAKGFGLSTLVQFGLGWIILVAWLGWAAAVVF